MRSAVEDRAKDKIIEWSKLFSAREKIHRRYRSIWDIPLIKKRSALLKDILKDGMSILDVGAGSKGMKEEIERAGVHITYRSMDTDRNIEHDFYDIADIYEVFDCITLFEVIEHLSFPDGFELLKRLRARLNENGILILSTPNIFTPGRFMRDTTHKTFYAYDELCGLLDLAGYKIKKVYRSYNDAIHRYLLKVYLFGFLFRFFGIDYAYSIFIVAEKA